MKIVFSEKRFLSGRTIRPSNPAHVMIAADWAESAIQEPVITALLEAGRQYMHQETADEFRIFQGNGPSWLPGLSSAGGEGGPFFIYRENAAVGECDLMGISPEIFDGISISVEGFLNKRSKGIILPLYEKLYSFLLERDILHANETTCQVLHEKGLAA